jgi:hypothetical protein
MSEESYSSASVPNSTLAIIALIAGILGVTLFPLIGSIVAVIVGPMAKREIAESGGTLGGEGLAQIGMILGWIGLALSLCGCCIAIGAFGFSFFIAMFAIGAEEFSLILPMLFVL